MTPLTDPTLTAQRAAVAEFLGPSAAAGDWASLLGLNPETYQASEIIPALQRQLTRITDHPRGLSSEADEVRLLLHAGAARLLDPRARAGRGDAGSDIRSALILTMAMHGGWNRRSLRQLTQLAQSAGVAPDELVGMLHDLTQRPTRADAAGQPAHPHRPPGLGSEPVFRPRPGVAPTTAQRPEAAESPRPAPMAAPDEEVGVGSGAPLGAKVAVAVVGGLVVMVAVSIVLVGIMRSSPPATPGANGTDGNGGSAGPSAVTSTEPARPRELFPAGARNNNAGNDATAAAKPTPQERIDLRRQAASILAELDIDPSGSVDRFEAFIDRLAVRWPEFAADEQVAITNSVIEFLYRASIRPELGGRAVGAITRGVDLLNAPGTMSGDDVLRAVWSLGMVNRLSRERDLPATVQGRLTQAIGETSRWGVTPSDASFSGGAQAALTIAASRLTPTPPMKLEREVFVDGWRGWRRAVDAAFPAESVERQRAVLAALETLMMNGPEATANEGVFEIVQALATAVTWRTGDESRQWLIRWLVTPAVGSGDLHAVTAALATRSSAPGVDLSFVSSAGASASERAQLRDRYATVWGLATGQRREAYAGWTQEADRRAAATPPEHPLQQLGQALVLARVNRAARDLWRGAPVAVLLASLDLDQSLQGRIDEMSRDKSAVGTVRYFGVENGEWLVKYLAAGTNIPVRRELLAQMNRAPTPVEAEVIVAEACRGSPVQVRQDAIAIVRRHAAEAGIVAAMLEFAPLIPQTIDNAGLIEYVSVRSLPPIRDEQWRVAVRRVLVERLLEVGARQLERGVVDQIAAQFTRVYGPDSEAPIAEDDPELGERLIAYAQSERVSLQREAASLPPTGREPLSLAEASGRRAPRLAAADGPVQRFAAEQASMTELLAYIVAAEQPGRAGDVKAVLDEFVGRRREATHIFQQIHAAEHAMARLWLIRVGEGGES